MSGPAGGGFDFNLMQQMNAGGKNSKEYAGLIPLLPHAEKAGLFSVMGEGANTLQGLAGFGASGIATILGGASGENSTNPIRKMFAAMFPKDGFKAFADGSSNASSDGGGGGSGSNHPFSTVGSAVGTGFDGVSNDMAFQPGMNLSPSATPGKGAGQDAGMGMG